MESYIGKSLDKLVQLGSKVVHLPINYIYFKLQRVAFQDMPKIAGLLCVLNRGILSIVTNCILTSNRKSNPVGGASCTSLYVSPNPELKIGNGVRISNSVLFAQKRIIIEDNVFIGGGCQIYDSDFHSLNYNERIQRPDRNIKMGEVVIQKGAFIGTSSIIMKGVNIGEYAVLAAGSVVVKSIPANEVWGGNPAKFIKSI